MASERVTPIPDQTFCIYCGYPLRGLASMRCPECGRTFDPANPRTMSLGSPIQAWKRLFLWSMEWPTVALAVAGTFGLLYLSRQPGVWPESPALLVREFRLPDLALKPTVPDVVFFSSMILWGIFLVLAGLPELVRLLLVPRSARPYLARRFKTAWVRRVVMVAIALSIFFLMFGWKERIGRRWMARVLHSAPSSYPWTSGTPDPPVSLSPKQSGDVLGTVIAMPATPADRLKLLSLLVERAGREGSAGLRKAAGRERDTSVLLWEIRLLGLCRDPESASFLIKHLDDSRPDVRAAAADAIGILRQPSYPIFVPAAGLGFYEFPVSLDSTPPIDVSGIIVSQSSPDIGSPNDSRDLALHAPVPVAASVRTTLQRMMTDGQTAEEREAAARALVIWPPEDYTLRVAEWGVWLAGGGHIALTQSLLGEIPPFVHRTGNPISDFSRYFAYPRRTSIFKPIVHLTCAAPMAVDVEVHIRDGRPWFAYPKPDDIALGLGGQQRVHRFGQAGWIIEPDGYELQKDFATPPVASLDNIREGYPWLRPHHRLYAASLSGIHELSDLGLHWQSIIVTPDLPAGATLPSIPADIRFDWWKRLRQVPSGWVTSRGETERFLYYDGPTESAVPIIVTLDALFQRLRFAPNRSYTAPPLSAYDRERLAFHPFMPEPNPRLPEHEGLYIEYRNGILRGQAITLRDATNSRPEQTMTLAGELPLRGDGVIAAFREMLLRYGLTAPEAEGMVAAWTPQLFGAEGRRFVLRMSPEDYARQCPIEVRPAPTAIVRLGLVLTEFDGVPNAHPVAQ